MRDLLLSLLNKQFSVCLTLLISNFRLSNIVGFWNIHQKDFPADQVEAENKRLNQAKKTLNVQRVEVEAQLKASQHATFNKPNLERFIEEVQHRLAHLSFEDKQQALKMLDITVWLDGQDVEITGVLDTSIVLTPS